MDVTRRTFSGMLAGALATPRLAFAQTKSNCAFYSGVGGQLTHYEVDFGAATLAKRAAVTLPGGIQYAWPHPGRRYLYVATSSGGIGIAPVPGYPPDQHYLAAFRVTPLGELSPHGELIKLRQRPVHASVDHAGEHVLVAYNFPSNVSVHKIKADGSIGEEVKQSDKLETGIYFHQIRATPADKTVLIVARGNNPQESKPEDPGSLHVYDFKNGVLSHRRKIAPNGGYGYGGRHLDIHPTQPWVYLSVERQNQLIAYKMTPDGDLAPEPLFTKPTLADPANKFRIQSVGPIHVHPSGRFVYLGNRSGAGPGGRSRSGECGRQDGFQRRREQHRGVRHRPADRRANRRSARRHSRRTSAHFRARYRRAVARGWLAVAQCAARGRQSRGHAGRSQRVPDWPGW
jgi:6-phosphogluconolactonase (cycloisomerase 2 family)